MAKYCTNCGKELKGGQPCDCKKDPIVENEMVNNIIEVIKSMFIKPIDTIKKFTKSKNFENGMLLNAITSVIAGLFGTVIAKSIYTMIYGSTYTIIGITTSVEVPYLRIFFIVAILTFASSFAYSAIMYLVNNSIFKGKGNYKETYALYSVCLIPLALTLLIGAVLSFVSSALSIVIIGLGVILNIVYLYHGLKLIGPKDDNTHGYIYVTTTAFYLIAIFILICIFGG